MLTHVYCGFQTGVDQAGARAAEAADLITSGWMPRGYRTEDGPRPHFAEQYGAREHASPEYPPRTEANVLEADTTIWYGPEGSPGYWCTRKAAERNLKAFWVVGHDPAELIAKRIIELEIESINVAG